MIDRPTLTLHALSIADAAAIDAVRLIDTGHGPMLLSSTQAAAERGSELVIRAAPIADPAASFEVARVPQLLPPPPWWDARAVTGGCEVVCTRAGGAADAILHIDAAGTSRMVSAEHWMESFSRPRFVGVSDVGAVVAASNGKPARVVVFVDGLARPVSYTELGAGDDGVVGRSPLAARDAQFLPEYAGEHAHWAAVKTNERGYTVRRHLAGTAVDPGQLVLRIYGCHPTGLAHGVYEVDAAPLAGDIVAIATGLPARLVLGGRPERPCRLAAADSDWLHELARPAILVAGGHVHVAALVRFRTAGAFVVHGAASIADVVA